MLHATEGVRNPELMLSGKLALVTGGGRGIGRALAVGFASAGAVVLVGDKDLHGAEESAGLITATGARAHPLRLDVSRVEDVQQAVAFAANLGGLDILVNNAGVFPRSAALDLAKSEWDHVLAVNLTGTFLCAQAAARQMVGAGRGGRIVNITSGAAFRPTANAAHYSASKAGIVALTRTLAIELAPHHITVNAVAPGITDTAQPRIAYSEADLQDFARQTPLGRIAQPGDMVSPVLFLCGDQAGYITGQTLHVNGGLYMP
jgi:3-oxoacyl-[acyl-carrier protein] reductase